LLAIYGYPLAAILPASDNCPIPTRFRWWWR